MMTMLMMMMLMMIFISANKTRKGKQVFCYLFIYILYKKRFHSNRLLIRLLFFTHFLFYLFTCMPYCAVCLFLHLPRIHLILGIVALQTLDITLWNLVWFGRCNENVKITYNDRVLRWNTTIKQHPPRTTMTSTSTERTNEQTNERQKIHWHHHHTLRLD